jgi:hypothetical protein
MIIRKKEQTPSDYRETQARKATIAKFKKDPLYPAMIQAKSCNLVYILRKHNTKKWKDNLPDFVMPVN